MKGNSERVYNKNLKLFAGKPLYHRITKTLLKSNYISKIIVNTDSNKIINDINISFDNKITINKRPNKIIGDYVSMNDIIKYDISCFDSNIYIQTHSTNPMLKVETIDKAIKKMIYFEKSKKYDSIFSVSEIKKRFYSKDAKPLNHDPYMLVTQHLEPIYEENSSFYLFSKDSFTANNNNRIGIKPFMYEINKSEAVDIDYPEDFVIAEGLYNILRK